jgi:hypothetical protein
MTADPYCRLLLLLLLLPRLLRLLRLLRAGPALDFRPSWISL